MPVTLTEMYPFTVGNNSSAYPRYDIIWGQASYDSSTGVVSPVFSYQTGGSDSAPATAPSNEGWAAVAVITVAKGSTFNPTSVQILLPSLIVGGNPQTSVLTSNSAPPSVAVNVTGPPFFTPYIAGNLQQNISPTEDAMAYIKQALDTVGPGGAIYIPSGVYGVMTTATTKVETIYTGSSESQKLGQTIIFGGDVTFVALRNLSSALVPAFS